MKPIISLIFALTLMVAAAPRAMAAWTAFAPLPVATSATSTPSCAYVANNKVACAVRNNQGRLAVSRFGPSAWSAWTVLTETVASDPSCVERGTSEVICAVRNSDNKLVFTIYNGTSWTPLALAGTGGQFFSGPSCARHTTTKIICVGRSANGGLTAARLSGTTWAFLASVVTTTAISSAPNCGSDFNGKVICIARDTVGGLLVNRTNGSAWEGFLTLAGASVSIRNPLCEGNEAPGQIVCLYYYYGYTPYSTKFVGGAWLLAGWGSFTTPGGVFVSEISCAAANPGVFVCTGISTDGKLYSAVYNGLSWSGFVVITSPATFIGNPACAKLTVISVLCVVTAPDNKLHSTIGP